MRTITVLQQRAAILVLLATTGLLPALALAQDSATPPIAWWKLNDTAGTVVRDTVGNYPLTLDGGTPAATLGVTDTPAGMPVGSTSFLFNSITNNGQLATRAATAALCGRTFTVSAWVKPADATPDLSQEFILGPIGGLAAGWSLRWLSDSGTRFGVQYGRSGGWYQVAGAAHVVGSWYHVVFQIVDDGTSDHFRLYVDGVLEDETSISLDYVPDPTAGFILGGRNYTKWDGGLDDVQYYDYALTTNDIAYLRDNPGRAIGQAQIGHRDSFVRPVAWWKLDEASGSTFADERGQYPLALTGGAPDATVGATDVPADMPPGSKCVTFNGNDVAGQYASRAYTAALAGKTFSLAAWIKAADSTPDRSQECIFASLSTTIAQGWVLRWESLTGGGLRLSPQVGNGSGWLATPVYSSVLVTGAWYHVVFQIEDNGASDNYRIYINGSLDGQTQGGGNLGAETSDPFVMGGRLGYTRWEGGLDDVQYYDYVLTSNDVRYLYLNPGVAIEPPHGTVIAIK